MTSGFQIAPSPHVLLLAATRWLTVHASHPVTGVRVSDSGSGSGSVSVPGVNSAFKFGSYLCVF